MFDSGSSIDVVKNENSFTSKPVETKGVNVRSSSGLYEVNKMGEVMSFGKRYLDKRQFINIISEYSVVNNENIVITTAYDAEGKKRGYNLHVLKACKS